MDKPIPLYALREHVPVYLGGGLWRLTPRQEEERGKHYRALELARWKQRQRRH